MTETVQERLQPEGLPSDWTYDRASHTVTCGGCMFRFGAEHFTADTEDACPVCSENTLIKERDEARAANREINEHLHHTTECFGNAVKERDEAREKAINDSITALRGIHHYGEYGEDGQYIIDTGCDAIRALLPSEVHNDGGMK